MAAKGRTTKFVKSRSLPPGFSFVSTSCSLELEQHFWNSGLQFVIGIDEAGRGPLAGVVTAGAALLPRHFTHTKLTDSKKLSPKQREAIYQELKEMPEVVLASAEASVEEIDRINILKATHLAMRRASAALQQKIGITEVAMSLIDGLAITGYPWPQQPVVKGDAHCLSIAAASIVAKVERDQAMELAHEKWPQYGFADHKGYGTAAHLAALKKHGACPLHRRSFAPVAELLAQPELDFRLE
jgi:ribonuclease HII